MAIFGNLDLRLDPWQVEYGSEIPLDSEQEPASDESAILDVEVDSGEWRPITPAPVELSVLYRIPLVSV
jgi:hypothetical protein